MGRRPDVTMSKGWGSERQQEKEEGQGSEDDCSECPGQNRLTWGSQETVVCAWILDDKRALNPSWTSPVSPGSFPLD